MSKCTRNCVYKLEHNSSHKVCNVQKWILTLFALKIQEIFRNSYEMCLWLAKEWKKEQKSRIFVHIIYIVLITEQKPSKSSKAFFERASLSKIFFERYRVRAFFEQDFLWAISSSSFVERLNFRASQAKFRASGRSVLELALIKRKRFLDLSSDFRGALFFAKKRVPPLENTPWLNEMFFRTLVVTFAALRFSRKNVSHL